VKENNWNDGAVGRGDRGRKKGGRNLNSFQLGGSWNEGPRGQPGPSIKNT